MASSPSAPDAVAAADEAAEPRFRVTLEGFDGPFDLLLSLINKHELDITEIALSTVTSEFISYLEGIETEDDLEQASEFLVVAATLLDLKIVGLLPQGELVDAEDVAMLEARDLLFARLLQYRAFKEVSAWFARAIDEEAGRTFRDVPLEARFVDRTPPLRWTTSLDDFAAIALLAFTPREIPTVGLEHLHAPTVSIREQAAVVVSILKGGQPVSFREIIAGVAEKGVIIARFLAVLELYRHASLTFEQIEPLGDLVLEWTADNWTDENLAALGADYDN